MASRELTASDGAVLSGTVQGAGSPAVMCHGGPGLWDYFDEFAAELSSSLTVHRWDQRGCGRSEPSSGYGLDVAVQDVQDVKRAFGMAEPWVVFGHSWGAYLALLTALAHSESTSALVYISGTGTPSWWSDVGSAAYKAERTARMSPAAQHRLARLAVAERSWDDEVEFRRLSWMTDFADQDHPPDALDVMASAPVSISWKVSRALNGAELWPDSELLDRCDACEIPSLFIHGSRDPRADNGARLLSERIPNSRFVLIEGAGHLPWVERPQETSQTVQAFLADVLV